ncbi:hypothetical protein HID58_074596 [Brassica napus]|uniref:Uncharacterized protein n=1 Tax=Brassica napus TaxID=3708 RepID=A0ABQ7YH76_BRANA|nr:hypothetical protein HID58_074596 [Brassica napus]
MIGSSYRKFSFSWGKGAVPKIGPRVLRSREPGCLLAGTQRPEGSNPNYVIMAVDEHNEQPEATPREAELQRQLDGIQSQVTELNRARVEVAENPELSSEVQKRRILRESRSHNGSRGGNPGEIPRLLVVPPGQEQMSMILFFRIPMFHSLLQPFLHELPSGRRLHLLNQQIPASHHVLHLTTKEEHLAN